jgi:hypothetical protein
MRKIIYLTLLNSMLFASCKGQNEQLDCFNTSLKNDELKSILIELTTGLNDTLNEWINVRKYKNVQVFKTTLWKIDDAVFISLNKDKAILLILKQDTIKYNTEPSDKENEPEKIVPSRFDYVKMIYANKEQDGWHYYYQSLPSIVVPRDENINDIPIPITFEELSLVGRRSVLKGYYKSGTCKYNDKFFERWDIKNLKEQHKKINGYY